MKSEEPGELLPEYKKVIGDLRKLVIVTSFKHIIIPTPDSINQGKERKATLCQIYYKR